MSPNFSVLIPPLSFVLVCKVCLDTYKIGRSTRFRAMGFKSVYRTLQELFPQVDARLLKAAAIEHSKDPNGAVEFILAEVLPYTTKVLDTSSSSIGTLGYLSSVEKERICVADLVASSCASSSKHASTSLPGGAANEAAERAAPSHVDPACLNERVHGSLDSIFCVTKNINEQSIGNIIEAANVSEKLDEPNHVDVTSLHETVHESVDTTFDTKNINDQLSGKTVEAANQLAEMKEPRHLDPTSLHETVHGSLGLTFCDSKDIGDQSIGNTGAREPTASRACDVGSTEAVQNMSCDGSVSHAYEEVYDGEYDRKLENGNLEDTAVLQKYKDLERPDTSYSSSSSAVLENVPDACSNKEHISSDSYNNPFSRDLNGSILVDGQKKHSSVDINSLYGSNYVELACFSKDQPLEYLDCSIQSEVKTCMSASSVKIVEHNKIVDGRSTEDIHIPDSVSNKESSTMHTVVTRSGQICSTDLLEDLVEDSKSHKKTLFSAMDSVLKLMREVEVKEKVAEQAKEDAAKGGLEILARVDELKRMLNNAREENDMHSGEVYGERAILATEMRELQSRLLVLSDEKDKSLSILDTMLEALEIRLAAAEAERIAAEQEKVGKEESARKALAEQELIMDKLVRESKILQHEAEENAKLREFLVDRGRAVDMLQGEISVICQDVKLLKEKFDSHGSLSQCLSSKPTSCILASSGSSLNSSESQEVLAQAKLSMSFDEPILLPSVEQVRASDQDELVDEGWELFDSAA